MPRVKVGDRVRLNDEGLERLFGFTRGLSHMKTLVMTVTSVDPESMTDDVPLHIVEVDNPEINHGLIDDHCFDVVPKR